MEDKPLTESINKQYSKYGSLRNNREKESRIELCNAEDPMRFLTRIDSSIKDAKERVKKSIDKSTISEEYDSSSYNQDPNDNSLDTIPMVKLDRTFKPAAATTTTTTVTTAHNNDTSQQSSDPSPSLSSNQ